MNFHRGKKYQGAFYRKYYPGERKTYNVNIKWKKDLKSNDISKYFFKQSNSTKYSCYYALNYFKLQIWL